MKTSLTGEPTVNGLNGPRSWWPGAQRWAALLILVAGLPGCEAGAASSPVHCDLCNRLFVQVTFRVQDMVSGETRIICHVCNKSEHLCYACGMPIIKNRLSLEDGRHYCARDARTAVTDTNAVLRLAREADATLRRELRDYLSFPDETELDVRVIDRIELQDWYKLPGHDQRCPNVLGLYEAITNNGVRTHRIHVLSGQTAGETRATYAHELTHAWLAANVPAERQLGRLAAEGFCELIGHLLVRQLNDARTQQVIASNAYTRGQFALFRAASESYTLQPVIDWIKFGQEAELDAADIDMVRRAEPPPRQPPRNYVRYVTPEEAARWAAASNPDEFELKAIVGTSGRRTALINGRAFLAGETGKVRKGTEWVAIKCVEITADGATMEVLTTGEVNRLRLAPQKQP